jgi:hypothetical protein
LDPDHQYLIKWRALPYSECTWETAADVQNDKLIGRFHKFELIPQEATKGGSR